MKSLRGKSAIVQERIDEVKSLLETKGVRVGMPRCWGIASLTLAISEIDCIRLIMYRCTSGTKL